MVCEILLWFQALFFSCRHFFMGWSPCTDEWDDFPGMVSIRVAKKTLDDKWKVLLKWDDLEVPPTLRNLMDNQR